MNKQEAIQAMEQGKKVAHRFFDPHEWMTIKGTEFVFENNTSISKWLFWQDRKDVPAWEEDWRIVEEPESIAIGSQTGIIEAYTKHILAILEENRLAMVSANDQNMPLHEVFDSDNTYLNVIEIYDDMIEIIGSQPAKLAQSISSQPEPKQEEDWKEKLRSCFNNDHWDVIGEDAIFPAVEKIIQPLQSRLSLQEKKIEELSGAWDEAKHWNEQAEEMATKYKEALAELSRLTSLHNQTDGDWEEVVDNAALESFPYELHNSTRKIFTDCARIGFEKGANWAKSRFDNRITQRVTNEKEWDKVESLKLLELLVGNVENDLDKNSIIELAVQIREAIKYHIQSNAQTIEDQRSKMDEQGEELARLREERDKLYDEKWNILRNAKALNDQNRETIRRLNSNPDDLGGTGHGDISYSDADPGL